MDAMQHTSFASGDFDFEELEALLDFRSGTGAELEEALPLDEHDIDVSALILDDVLAQCDALSRLNSAQRAQLSPAAAQRQSIAAEAPQPAAQLQSEAHDSKVERKRAQNREAQARFRQKAKVHSSRLSR